MSKEGRRGPDRFNKFDRKNMPIMLIEHFKSDQEFLKKILQDRNYQIIFMGINLLAINKKENYTVTIDLKPTTSIDIEYIKLNTEGQLTIAKGYAWDGPSGPTIDTLSFMRGSLIHDALYQLMRESHLHHHHHRNNADRILQKICKEDGMWALRALWVYKGVQLFADPAADPASTRPLTKAPKDCQS